MGKQDVIGALTFQNPQFLPKYMHWFSYEIELENHDEIEKLKTEYPDDIMLLHLNFTEKPSKQKYQELFKDEWGCLWRHSKGGVGHHLEKPALPSLNDNLEQFLEKNVPDISYSQLVPTKEDMKRIREKNPDCFILGVCWRSYFERMWMLVGMENLFEGIYLYPDKIALLEEFLCNYTLALIDRWGEVGVDGIYLADDWGSQSSTLISPDKFRMLFKESYRKMFAKIHNYDMYTFFHSDGNIIDLIEDFIEIGLDVLNPLQSSAIDMKEAARRFGGRICFMGGIDVQHKLTEYSPGEIYQYLIKTVETLGSFNGGYIACPDNTIMPETPIANIRAINQAVTLYNDSL